MEDLWNGVFACCISSPRKPEVSWGVSMGSNESTFVVVWCLGLPSLLNVGNCCWGGSKEVWKLGVDANVPRKEVVPAQVDVSIQSAGAEELLICCVEDNCDVPWDSIDISLIAAWDECLMLEIGWRGAAIGNNWVTTFDWVLGFEVFCK